MSWLEKRMQPNIDEQEAQRVRAELLQIREREAAIRREQERLKTEEEEKKREPKVQRKAREEAKQIIEDWGFEALLNDVREYWGGGKIRKDTPAKTYENGKEFIYPYSSAIRLSYHVNGEFDCSFEESYIDGDGWSSKSYTRTVNRVINRQDHSLGINLDSTHSKDILVYSWMPQHEYHLEGKLSSYYSSEYDYSENRIPFDFNKKEEILDKVKDIFVSDTQIRLKNAGIGKRQSKPSALEDFKTGFNIGKKSGEKKKWWEH